MHKKVFALVIGAVELHESLKQQFSQPSLAPVTAYTRFIGVGFFGSFV